MQIRYGSILKKVLNRSISATDVILSTDLGDELILIISVIAYFIYKNWLAESYNDEARVLDNCINNLQHFVKYKKSICKCQRKPYKVCNARQIYLMHLDSIDANRQNVIKEL